MATYYVDLYNGDDANDGLTWATAWLTMTKVIATAVNYDTIKFAKHAVTDTGVIATWTFDSTTITLATPLTATINNAIGNTWTSSTNVTGATYTVRKIGANCQQFTFGAAFTTGKAAFKALPSTLDLSAYTKISFWVMASVGTNLANTFKLCLCSDASGDVIVNSFLLPKLEGNVITPLVLDFGAALGSTINSIALYCDIDPATTVIRLNNIFACNSLTLNSFITKGTTGNEEYYPIQSIDGTAIKFDRDNDNYVTSFYYTGTTEDVSLKVISGSLTTIPSNNGTNIYTLSKKLILVGGYNTATDTVDGQTMFDGRVAWGTLFYQTSADTYFSNFIFARYRKTIIGVWNFTNCQFIGNYSAVTPYTGGSNNGLITNTIFCHNNYGIDGGTTVVTLVNVINCSFIGNYNGTIQLYAYGIYFDTCIFRLVKNAVSSALVSFDRSDKIVFKNCTFTGGYYSLWVLSSNITFDGCTINASHMAANILRICIINFINCDFNFTTISCTMSEVLFDYCLFTSSMASNTYGNLKYRNHNRVIGDNSSTCAIWQTEIKQGTDPGAWLYNAYFSQIGNLKDLFKLSEIAVEANKQTTIRIWVRKEAALSAGVLELIIPKDLSLGITEDVVTQHDDDTVLWREVGISVIPTATGIIRLYVSGQSSGAKYYLGSISLIES